MNDVYKSTLEFCPFFEDSFFDYFWLQFRFSVAFINYVFFGMGIWNKDIHLFLISIGLSLNESFAALFQKILGFESIFPECGDVLSTPPILATTISFFYIIQIFYQISGKFGGFELSYYHSFLISFWNIFSLYSLFYLSYNSYFQIALGIIFGLCFAWIYIFILIAFIFPYERNIINFFNSFGPEIFENKNK